MRKRLKQMLIKEFLQIFRDPRMRMTVFGLPVVQMVILAFALTTDVTKIRTAVLDFDNTPDSRDLVAAFVSSNYFRVEEVLHSQGEIAPTLDHGDFHARVGEATSHGRTGLARTDHDRVVGRHASPSVVTATLSAAIPGRESGALRELP